MFGSVIVWVHDGIIRKGVIEIIHPPLGLTAALPIDFFSGVS